MSIPMQGLAEQLRKLCRTANPEACEIYERWASEVEAAQAALSGAEPEQQDSFHLTEPVGQAATAQRWIAVSERLPAYFQPVALIHERTWLNTGDYDHNINKIDAGYRQEFGDCWATAGSHRAMTLDAFTHWLPLPSAPGSQSDTGRPRSDGPIDGACQYCAGIAGVADHVADAGKKVALGVQEGGNDQT